MKQFVTTVFVLLSACAVQAQPMEDRQELIKITEGIAQNLSEGNFAAVTETFDETMTNAFKEPQIKQVWDGLVAQVGAYQETGTVTTKKFQGYRIIYQILKFENAPFKLKAVYNEAKEVAGLALIPVNAE